MVSFEDPKSWETLWNCTSRLGLAIHHGPELSRFIPWKTCNQGVTKSICRFFLSDAGKPAYPTWMAAGLATLNVDKRCFYRHSLSLACDRRHTSTLRVLMCSRRRRSRALGSSQTIMNQRWKDLSAKPSVQRKDVPKATSSAYNTQEARWRFGSSGSVQSVLSRNTFLSNLLKAKKILKTKQLSLNTKDHSL